MPPVHRPTLVPPTHESVVAARRDDLGYGALVAQVRAAGLLDRAGSRYLPRAVCLAALLAAGGAALFLLGDSLWQLAVAAYSGLVLGQLAFLGHDAGHQQISCVRRRNDVIGTLIATLGVGLSYGWWVDKHNRHHRHPNQLGNDPDVERGILAWTDDQASRQQGVFRWIAGHQAAIFFPLLLLEGWNLHVSSMLAIRRRDHDRMTEGALLVLHVALGVTVLLLALSPVRAIEFLAIQQSVLGLYIGVSFAPNHKGMPLIAADACPGFAERQVRTSRNISGGRALATMFGGLNYQIEHHLFPSMPSRNLRHCRPMVQAFCVARSLPYTETDIFASYTTALRYLHHIRAQPAVVLQSDPASVDGERREQGDLGLGRTRKPPPTNYTVT